MDDVDRQHGAHGCGLLTAFGLRIVLVRLGLAGNAQGTADGKNAELVRRQHGNSTVGVDSGVLGRLANIGRGLAGYNVCHQGAAQGIAAQADASTRPDGDKVIAAVDGVDAGNGIFRIVLVELDAGPIRSCTAGSGYGNTAGNGNLAVGDVGRGISRQDVHAQGKAHALGIAKAAASSHGDHGYILERRNIQGALLHGKVTVGHKGRDVGETDVHQQGTSVARAGGAPRQARAHDQGEPVVRGIHVHIAVGGAQGGYLIHIGLGIAVGDGDRRCPCSGLGVAGTLCGRRGSGAGRAAAGRHRQGAGHCDLLGVVQGLGHESGHHQARQVAHHGPGLLGRIAHKNFARVRLVDLGLLILGLGLRCAAFVRPLGERTDVAVGLGKAGGQRAADSARLVRAAGKAA